MSTTPEQKLKRRRPPVVPLVILLILAAAAGWWWWVNKGDGAAMTAPATALWQRWTGPADPNLTLQGNVEVRQVNLGFKVAGRITQLAVDEGDQVVEGQPLAVLDKVYFEDSLAQIRAQRDQMQAQLAKLVAGNRAEDIAQAEAAVAEREASLTNAQVDLERAKALLKGNVGTHKTYDDALAAERVAEAQLNSARQALVAMKAGPRKEDIDAARAQLASTDAAVRVAERSLTDAELKAPSAGVVLSRVRENGAIVNPGETVLVLSLTAPVWVRTYVSELDLPRIHPGDKVRITLDAPGAKPLEGRIGFISTTAEFTPKTVETRELRTALVYRVRIVVDDPGDALRQGMPVTVNVPPADAHDGGGLISGNTP